MARQNIFHIFSNLIPCFLCVFFEIIQLLVEETNIFCYQYLDTFKDCSSLPDMTTRNVLAVICCYSDGSWQKKQTVKLLVHARTILYDLLWTHIETRQIFHILIFLHLSNNGNETDNYTKIMTFCGTWELLLISSVMRMLNIRTYLNI